ncbi:hypothetical protein AAKU64_002840 [Undibacterium sp. GrIS 1.8]
MGHQQNRPVTTTSSVNIQNVIWHCVVTKQALGVFHALGQVNEVLQKRCFCPFGYTVHLISLTKNS